MSSSDERTPDATDHVRSVYFVLVALVFAVLSLAVNTWTENEILSFAFVVLSLLLVALSAVTIRQTT